MNAAAIIRAREADWSRLGTLLATGIPRRHGASAQWMELATLYRAACSDVARLRAAGADDETVAHLESLLARAHATLYRSPPGRAGAIVRFLFDDFPRTLRKNRAFFAWSTAAFYGPFIFGLLAGATLEGFAPAVMGPEQVNAFREMYSHAPEAGRSAGESSAMLSFYVQHNTSIAFQVFANGIFAGLGSVFMLLYQGLAIGTTVGFLIGDDKARNLLVFICGHSAWELTAITISGAAGLRMGWALVATGGLTRRASLRASGPDVARMIGGAAVMLAVAATIESLWSPSAIPAAAKWGFAAVQVAIVAVYLTRSGRADGGVAS